MDEYFEIYFSDLTVGAQERLMRATGISRPEEMNWDIDICPLVFYPIPVLDDDIFFNIEDCSLD